MFMAGRALISLVEKKCNTGPDCRAVHQFIYLPQFYWDTINIIELYSFKAIIASLVAQTVNNLPEMQKTPVWFLGWEDPLEKGMATHSSIFAWRIPCTEDFVGYSSWGCKESDMIRWLTHTHSKLFNVKQVVSGRTYLLLVSISPEVWTIILLYFQYKYD